MSPDYNEQRADDAGYPEGRPTAPSEVNRAAISNRELAERKRIYEKLLADERALNEQTKLTAQAVTDANDAHAEACYHWAVADEARRNFLAAHPEIEED